MTALAIIKSIAALCSVLALLAGGLWIAKRYGLAGAAGGFKRAEKRLAVVERLLLDPKRQLLLIRHDTDEMLILLTPDGAQPICSVSDPAAKPFDNAALTARWRSFAERQQASSGQAIN